MTLKNVSFFFVRSGSSQEPGPDIMDKDRALTDAGYAQALELQTKLGGPEGVKFDLVLTSATRRSQEMALAVLGSTNALVVPREALDCLYRLPDSEQQYMLSMLLAEIQSPRLDEVFKHLNHQLLSEFGAKAANEIHELLTQEWESVSGKRIMIVGHGVLLQAVLLNLFPSHAMLAFLQPLLLQEGDAIEVVFNDGEEDISFRRVE